MISILKPKPADDIIADIKKGPCEVKKFCNLFLFLFKKQGLNGTNRKMLQKLIIELDNHHIKIKSNISSSVSKETLEFLGEDPVEIEVSPSECPILDLSKPVAELLSYRSTARKILIKGKNIYDNSIYGY